jgi:hypothetical protein
MTAKQNFVDFSVRPIESAWNNAAAKTGFNEAWRTSQLKDIWIRKSESAFTEDWKTEDNAKYLLNKWLLSLTSHELVVFGTEIENHPYLSKAYQSMITTKF